MKRCPGNLRPAPAHLTPELVGRVIAQIGKPHIVTPAPVHPVPVPAVKPTLRIITAVPPKPKVVKAAPVPFSSDELKGIVTAFERGIALADLARTLGKPRGVVCEVAERRFGYKFGFRPRLRRTLSLSELLALGDGDRPASMPRDAAASNSPSLRSSPPAAGTRPASPFPARAATVSSASGIFAYAERVNSARQYLTAKGFTVRRDNPDELIARWAISGHFGLQNADDLFRIARSHGWEQGQ